MNNIQNFLFINACIHFYLNTPYQKQKKHYNHKNLKKLTKYLTFQEPDQVFDTKLAHLLFSFQQNLFLLTF